MGKFEGERVQSDEEDEKAEGENETEKGEEARQEMLDELVEQNQNVLSLSGV